jgi:DNA-binding response OmpR family regulator
MSKEILISDPERVIQEEFDRIFEAMDHHMLFTTNNEEALLKARLFKPDLIIGGKDLCQSIRADEEMKNIPFLILLDMFEEVSEKEQELLRPNGVISKPVNKNEVLDILDDINQEFKGEKKMAISDDDLGWKSLADLGKTGTGKEEKLSLDGLGDTEEEIIELVDVVEEPESRMSIDDFALHQKEEPIGEIAPIESWESQEKEEVGLEKELVLAPEEMKAEPEETFLRVEKEQEQTMVGKKRSAEDELLDKIELEEILRKMEKLQPSIEKEWIAERVEKVAEEVVTPVPQRAERAPEKAVMPAPEQIEEGFTGLEEFEAALRGEVGEQPAAAELQPLIIEEPKQETPKVSARAEVTEELQLQELAEEEFPEIFLEEIEEELDKLKEEELTTAQKSVEVEAEPTEEEEISELFGGELPSREKAAVEVTLQEEIAPPEEPGKEAAPPLDMEELFNIPLAEIPPQEQAFKEPTPMEPVEAAPPAEELLQAKVAEPVAAEIPRIPPEKMTPPLVHLDRRMEEVIAKGVQEVMQDFATKVIPEMAEHMIQLTMERIEAMVKEVIPDLAEKAIQEEIQRLQKGEKE